MSQFEPGEECAYKVLQYISQRNQRMLYHSYRKMENLDEENLERCLIIFYRSCTMTDRFISVLPSFYRTVLLKKAPVSEKIIKLIEEHHIGGLTSRHLRNVELLTFLLKNVNLARKKGYFSSSGIEARLKTKLSIVLRRFDPDELYEVNDRHIIQFYNESIKLLRDLNMSHDVPGVLIQIVNYFSTRPLIVESFDTLIDMEDTKPRTAFIDNHPDDLVPLLSIFCIQSTLAFFSSGLTLEDFSPWARSGFFYSYFNHEQFYTRFFKIFAVDTDSMYEVLLMMLAHPRSEVNHHWMDPSRFYSVMVEGATNGQTFYENHIHRNPDGMKFVFMMLKRINQETHHGNRSPESIALHSGLRDHLLDLLAEEKLHFNPAPYLKQLNLYLSDKSE